MGSLGVEQNRVLVGGRGDVAGDRRENRKSGDGKRKLPDDQKRFTRKNC